MNWLYSTYLGSLYLEFLLWLDSKKTKTPTKFLTPKEIAQVIRSYNLVSEGVTKMKYAINDLVNSKSKEEYNNILYQIENMLTFADEEANTDKAQLVYSLKEIYTKKGNKDIITATDRAKMIDQRINDMKELCDDKAKRQLLRDIRKAGEAKNTQLLSKLQTEFKTKYGGTDSRLRKS